jgi:predicted transglutaminase-like cysteine proteinase
VFGSETNVAFLLSRSERIPRSGYAFLALPLMVTQFAQNCMDAVLSVQTKKRGGVSGIVSPLAFLLSRFERISRSGYAFLALLLMVTQFAQNFMDAVLSVQTKKRGGLSGIPSPQLNLA